MMLDLGIDGPSSVFRLKASRIMWLSRKIFALSGIRQKYFQEDFYEHALLEPLGPSMYLNLYQEVTHSACCFIGSRPSPFEGYRCVRLLTSVVSFNAIAILIILNQRSIHESICFFRLALVFQG